MDKVGKVSLKVPLKNKDRISRLLEYYNVSWGWKLQPRDVEIATELFYQRILLKKNNKEDSLIMEALFSKENKLSIAKSLKTTVPALSNSISKLRKVGIVKGNKLNTVYMPISIIEDEFIFQITFNNGK